jgi:hypothetical protein
VYLPKIGLLQICSWTSTCKGRDSSVALHLQESTFPEAMMQLASIGVAQAAPGQQLEQGMLHLGEFRSVSRIGRRQFCGYELGVVVFDQQPTAGFQCRDQLIEYGQAFR